MNSQKTAIYAINKIHIEQKKVSFLFRKIKSRERERDIKLSKDVRQ